MEVSLKVGCLSSAVEKQLSDPSLHARMPDVSYLCLMSGLPTLNGDDDDSFSSFIMLHFLVNIFQGQALILPSLPDTHGR